MRKIDVIALACILCTTVIWPVDSAPALRPYNPLQDPAVRVVQSRDLPGQGEYMWYPGQLSAHLQMKRLQESKARCVRVNYPGKFYEPVFTTWFEKEVDLASDTRLNWQSTGKVSFSLNGQKQLHAYDEAVLPKGKSTLLFKVEAEENLPSIRVTLNGEVTVDDWRVSLDGRDWNSAESSPVFGTNGPAPLEDPELMAEIRPASVLPVRNATVENGTIRIGRHGFVLVDFFHLEMGKVSFRAKGSGQLTVSVGESPEEAMNDNRNAFEQYPIEPFELDGGASRIESPERALRYVKIYSENGCELTDVKFTAKIWPVNFLMSFECSDERINAIWHASVATLLTSTHGFYLDGIKRDYLPWSMDAVVSNFGGDYVFGQKQVALNGLSVSMLPLNPNRKDFGIPDYPLHALIGFRQLYQRYHDFETILAYRDRIRQLMALYASIQDSRGFVSSKAAGGRGFTPGWSTLQGPDRQGIPAYAQIMLYWNFMIAAEFAEKWGDPKEAEGYRNRAESLKAKIMEYFWDDDQGLFLNGYNRDGEFDSRISHHAQYWAVLAGIFPEERQDAMFSRLAEIPHYRGNVSFEKGYEFLAYSKARKVREMWDFLFDVFGDWLDQGHTRFPENFSYQSPRSEQLVFYKRPYGLSLCHGANGVPGIVAVLHGIAGFSQNPEKLNHYTLQPDWMDLQWARVEFPVKEGKIRMALVDRKHVEVEIPDGCVVEYVDQQGKRTKLSGKDTSYLQTGLD